MLALIGLLLVLLGVLSGGQMLQRRQLMAARQLLDGTDSLLHEQAGNLQRIQERIDAQAGQLRDLQQRLERLAPERKHGRGDRTMQ